MGVLQTIALRGLTVNAQEAPRVISPQAPWIPQIIGPVDRATAMTVPAVKRGRAIICSTIASFGIELYDDANAEYPDGLPWLGQPDPRMPRSTMMAATVDNLLFFGTAYWEVLTVTNGRPSSFAFVSHDRVSINVNPVSRLVEFYAVDGQPRPMAGAGSLITFQGEDEGLLASPAAIRRGVALQRAALNVANTPAPSGIIKNNGADLPERNVLGLLSTWKRLRQENSVGYMSQQFEFQPMSYSPVELALNEQISSNAGDIALCMNLDPWYVNAQNASMTYSNRIDIAKQLVSQTLRAYVDVIEQRLSMPDLCPPGYEVKFSLDGYLRSDPMERITVIEKMLINGIIDVTEARAMEDLAPRGSMDPEGISNG